MAGGAVRIKGLGELNRDFRKLSRDLSRDFKKELKEAAAPVGVTAERMALSEIRNMTSRWARTRIGATNREVYMVPSARRGRGRSGPGWGRPNLVGLMLDRSYEPALEQEEDALVERLGDVIDRMAGASNLDLTG